MLNVFADPYLTMVIVRRNFRNLSDGALCCALLWSLLSILTWILLAVTPQPSNVLGDNLSPLCQTGA